MSGTTCHICNGQGKNQTMGEEDCNSCMGTGRDTKSNSWAAPCRACNGSGRVTYCRYETCKTCGGKGKITVW